MMEHDDMTSINAGDEMKAEKDVLNYLNRYLKIELTAINQDFLHSRMLNNWGIQGLGKIMYKRSIVAMKQADKVIERIFVLDGLPNLQDLSKLPIGETVIEILEAQIDLQVEAHKVLTEAVRYFESVQDYISRKLFEEMVLTCEEHIGDCELHLDLIQDVGLENYLQTQL